MSKPPDPLPRSNRLDPDAMFAALDRVVVDTPMGIPHSTFPSESPFNPQPLEPVEELFASERDVAPEPASVPEPAIAAALPPHAAAVQAAPVQQQPVIEPAAP